MSFRQTSVSGFPAVALRSAQVEIVAVPAIGMKLTNLRRLNGREWLWRSGIPGREAVRPGAAFVDAGGLEECLPTIAGDPDHGDVWSRPWTADGDALALEFTIVSGAHKGEVVGLRATGLEVDELELLGMPGTLTVENGVPRFAVDE